MSFPTSLVSQPWQGIKGHSVANCALIYFYVREEPINEAGPLLSRLLSYTTRLIFQVDAPSPDLDHFTSLLSAALKPTDTQRTDRQVTIWTQRVDSLIRESCSFSGLHRFFTQIERLLITEELYDEVNNVTIKPAERKIDEQSPYGHYLQRCLDSYLSLEDDQFAKVVREVQSWIEGGEQSHSRRDNKGSKGSKSSAARRGDYSLARAEMEGFFDRSPSDAITHSLQETLIKNALFHYRTRAYESARASLEESLRLSRGVNDLKCISACDNLLRRIDYEEESIDPKRQMPSLPRSRPQFSMKDFWQVGREIDLGKPLLAVTAGLSELLLHNKGISKGLETDKGHSPEDFAECCLCQAKTWSQLGIGSNASASLQTCVRERKLLDQSAFERLALPMNSVRSRVWVDEGDFHNALSILLDSKLLQSLDMASFGEWQAEVWRLLYRAALQADSTPTLEAIETVRPEVVLEVQGSMELAWQDTPAFEGPNEASFDRNNKVTLTQQLLGNLKEAQTLRQDGHQFSLSLTMATQVMRRAEQADLFHLYRRGTLECAESLLALGNATKGKEIMDKLMPQILIEKSVEMRGRGSWVYARLLLKTQRDEEFDPDKVIPWLNRSYTAFQSCGLLKELSDVLYVQARLYDHLDMQKEKQKCSQDFVNVMEEWRVNRQSRLKVFDQIQSIVKLVGARVVAGG